MHTSNQAASIAPVRQTVAVEVRDFSENLANRAQQLAERVSGKLHPVMTSEAPRAIDNAMPEKKDGQEYPPLFNELRANFNQIQSALDSIEYSLSRTEL